MGFGDSLATDVDEFATQLRDYKAHGEPSKLDKAHMEESILRMITTLVIVYGSL